MKVVFVNEAVLNAWYAWTIDNKKIAKKIEPVPNPYGFSTGSWKKRSKARFFP
jgi:hypothetical protein